MPSKKTTPNFKEYKNKFGRKSLLTNALVIGRRPAAAGLSEPPVLPKPIFKKFLLRETNQTSLPFPEVPFSCLLFSPFKLCFRSMAAQRPLSAFLRLRVRRMELLDFQFTFHRFGPVWTPLTQNHSLSESSWPQPSSLPQVGNQGCRKLKSSASPKASANHGKPSKSKPPPDSQH